MELPVSDEAIVIEVTGDRGDIEGPVPVLFRHQLLLYIEKITGVNIFLDWINLDQYTKLCLH